MCLQLSFFVVFTPLGACLLFMAVPFVRFAVQHARDLRDTAPFESPFLRDKWLARELRLGADSPYAHTRAAWVAYAEAPAGDLATDLTEEDTSQG